MAFAAVWLPVFLVELQDLDVWGDEIQRYGFIKCSTGKVTDEKMICKYKLKNYIYYDKLMADLEFNSKSAIIKNQGETSI